MTESSSSSPESDQPAHTDPEPEEGNASSEMMGEASLPSESEEGEGATTLPPPPSPPSASNKPLMAYFDNDNDDDEGGTAASSSSLAESGVRGDASAVDASAATAEIRAKNPVAVVAIEPSSSSSSSQDETAIVANESESRPATEDDETTETIMMNGEEGITTADEEAAAAEEEGSEEGSTIPKADGKEEEGGDSKLEAEGNSNENDDEKGAAAKPDEISAEQQQQQELSEENTKSKPDRTSPNPTTAAGETPTDEITATSSAPKQTDSDNDDAANNDKDNAKAETSGKTSPNTQNFQEAERQAAIAAAISANSSTMSPSVAAGIAKVLTLPGLMSDKMGELGDRAAEAMASSGIGSSNGGASNGGGNGGRSYPPPPPRNANGSQQLFQSSPTMVALPPISSQSKRLPPGVPPPKSMNRHAMRPVRFEDAKIAFGELLEKERREAEEASKRMVSLADTEDSDELESKGGEDGEQDAAKQADGEDSITKTAASTDKTRSDETSKEIGESGNELEGEEKTTSPKDHANADEEGGEEGEASSPTGKAVENDDATGSSSSAADKADTKVESASPDDNATESKSKDTSDVNSSAPTLPPPKSPEKDTSTQKEQDATTMPDSYLRFLLLVARVPLIIEEHKKNKRSPKQPNPKDGAKNEHRAVPQAARAAAERAFDVLLMARRTYGTLSERQTRGEGPENAGGRDATTLFFAACSGELIPGEEPLECGSVAASVPVAAVNGQKSLPPPSTPPLVSKTTTGNNASSANTPLTATASSMASAVFSNVMSKMVTKKQSSFSDMVGKKMFMGQQQQQGKLQKLSMPQPFTQKPLSLPSKTSQQPQQDQQQDYEITISQEMLGLTVENVLERTIIRTLLPDGAAKKAGARVGSLIAKVGNIDTSNLTHFETIDELRQSQRPLKLTLREVGGDILRRAREEMGRLIRGRGLESNTNAATMSIVEVKPWRKENANTASRQAEGETFDSVLGSRWPSKSSHSQHKPSSSLVSSVSSVVAPPPPPQVMTRTELMHQAGKDLIRILALLVVGLERELTDLIASMSSENLDASVNDGHSHMSVKDLNEAIEITSKILFDYSRGLPEMEEKPPQRSTTASKLNSFQPPSSSFYPVPPGRVQGKKPGAAGRGPAGRGRGGGGRGNNKKSSQPSPLLRIGDALSRTRSFLVESNSVTATSLRWEIIDYLCAVLDLDTEMELSEKEMEASSRGKDGGGGGSPTNDLGSAGNILKLIVLNCSTSEDMVPDSVVAEDGDNASTNSEISDSESDVNYLTTPKQQHHNAGNPFLSVVHRLAASKSTSARVTATSLGPILWGHLDFPRQLQLRGVITRALHDVEVMVRKSTAAVLHEIAELVFDRRAVPWLVLMCERSMTDPEPQLRAAAMTLTWHLAEHLPNAFLGDASQGSRSLRRLPPRSSPTFMDVYLLQCKLFPVANNLAEDRVASVRLSVAAQCDRLCNALGEHWFSVIIDLLQALLSDGDERVRSEAILCMPRLIESVIVGTSNGPGDSANITVLESLLPLALKTQKDNSSVVRSSLAAATGELLIFLVGLGDGSNSSGNNEPPMSPGRTRNASLSTESDSYKQHKKYVDDTLIPILQKLLQDSDPEVTTASLRAVTNASRSGSHRDTATSTRVPACSHTTIADNLIDDSDDLVSLSSHHSHTSYQSERTAPTKPVFIPVLSEEQVLRLLPTLSNLATSTQWRVRQSAVEIVPALMGCTRRHETRHEISKLCFRLMNDKVDAVRKTAAECLCLGGSSLARHGEEDGGEWIKKTVIPQVGSCSKSLDSKQRLLSLKMVENIIVNGLCPTEASVVPTNHPVAAKTRMDQVESSTAAPGSPSRDDDESTTSSISAMEALPTTAATPLRSILNIAATLTTDNVPNVRLNVGRTFVSIIPLLSHEAIEQNHWSDLDYCAAILEKQLEEETARPGGGDQDVIYFARQAISLAEPLLRRMSSTLST